MAIKIGANLAYNGKLPNFERDSFETKAAMKAFDENSIDEGHLSYCKEDSNIYQYKHTNAVDATTGRWRIFKTDVDLSNYATKAEITTINNNIVDLHSSLESTQTDFVDLRNKVNAMPKTVFITQAAYNALTTKDANTIYYING